jgi:hypothetical protein
VASVRIRQGSGGGPRSISQPEATRGRLILAAVGNVGWSLA